ncbi:LysR family transcriptional regulator [Gordonia rubripertincta]|uniref:LysR family transcriptional regulator n=2 Tax=Gordonia rubripertincta TaxID=36822 RepID=A0AAW6R8V7_GORRU|nr:LysR family transcriptional regulator [Gordonia rubripertincta]MDG6780820.1 LysR family transcriptional regulator [Gordonia rubripertincta]NKY63259.1 LysR family transcriptional regulator [Gordonia rubripertincta]GAB87473.1 putative LysR family transcriptional regulator [Gordonia rubripertincta NBRC 101908]
MDLVRHLRFFVAVAEEGHFGDAAARLEMTQPPVSQGLRRLEKELGVQLIRRTSRGAELTDAGRDLLPRARLLIDDAARFLGEARHLHHGSEVLRWGAVPLAGAVAIAAVAQRLGDVSSGQEMLSATAVSLVEQVSAGTLDLAIVDAPCVTGTLATGPIVVFRRHVVVPANHPVTTTVRPRLRQLAGLDLCHPSRAANPPAHDQLIDRLRESGLDPRILPSSSSEHLVAAVAGSGAFGLTADAQRLASLDSISCLPIGRDATALRLRVVYRESALGEVADVATAALWKISKATG